MFEGSTDILGSTGHTQKLVVHLMQEKYGSGHTVYLDNFYNSLGLATKLLDTKVYTVPELLEWPGKITRKI